MKCQNIHWVAGGVLFLLSVLQVKLVQCILIIHKGKTGKKNARNLVFFVWNFQYFKVRRDDWRAVSFLYITVFEAVKAGLVLKVIITKLLQTVLLISIPKPKYYWSQWLHSLDWCHRCGGVPALGAGWAKKKNSIKSSRYLCRFFYVGWGCCWPVWFLPSPWSKPALILVLVLHACNSLFFIR